MQHIKTALKILAVLAVIGVGYITFAFVQKVKVKITLLAEQQKVIASFLVDTFPEQVKAYDAKHAPAQ